MWDREDETREGGQGIIWERVWRWDMWVVTMLRAIAEKAPSIWDHLLCAPWTGIAIFVILLSKCYESSGSCCKIPLFSHKIKTNKEYFVHIDVTSSLCQLVTNLMKDADSCAGRMCLWSINTVLLLNVVVIVNSSITTLLVSKCLKSLVSNLFHSLQPAVWFHGSNQIHPVETWQSLSWIKYRQEFSVLVLGKSCPIESWDAPVRSRRPCLCKHESRAPAPIDSQSEYG